MTKKVVSILVASATAAGMVPVVKDFINTESCLDGILAENPYVLDLDEYYYGEKGVSKDDNTPISIESISFVTDVNTSELPEYKAFMSKGILYYEDKANTQVRRAFCDCVPVDSVDYSIVAGKECVRTEYVVGTKDEPLNMYIDDSNELKLEWTWCTAKSLKMYDLKFVDTEGREWSVQDGEFYSIEITEQEIDESSESSTNTVSSDGLLLPFRSDFEITSTYDEYRGNGEYHKGVDLCSYGDLTVYATVGGTVEYANWENPYNTNVGFGQYVKIVGDDNLWHYYGHLSEIYVAEGDRVEAGEAIGYEGTTGSSTGNHLHYEIRDNGTPIDCTTKLGIPNDYTIVYVDESETEEKESDESDVEITDEFEIKALSFNRYFESSSLKANAMNLDDNGACSIGIIQFRASLAKELIRAIKDANPDGYNEIASKYNNLYDRYLVKSWDYFTIENGSDNYKFLTELLVQPWAVDAQWEFTLNYIKTMLDDAKENGITKEDNLLMFTRCYINAGPNSDSAYYLRENPNASIDEMYANISITSKDKVFDVLKTKDFPMVSKEDLM